MPKKRSKKAPKPSSRKRAPKAKPKRYDWSRRKAPKPGSKNRAAYEASAIYRTRKKRAQNGVITRKKHERQEQVRLERQERRDLAKERLAPLLAKVVASWKRRRYFSDTREAHANWYEAKLNLKDFMPKRDYTRVLEDLSDEFDLDSVGWDIIY